ncbi:probable serine/threonine-protein kinase pats1 [Antedon mediterranea]|uniref:probable serine/threonine-protein kinase pats1 n=1 Tax=Antedon mediterranea TaxID=105859 RepID=UPI003AF622F9
MGIGKENVSDLTSIWDYAGQLDYYITHRFFLTNTVSYCVAFNVMDNLDEPAKPRDSKIGQLGMTNLDMNLFWIRSIYEHTVQHGSGNTISIDGKNIGSPPICLVATHVDKLSGTASEKEEEVMKMYKKMFDKMEGMPYAHHVDREMYMVDNTMKSPEGITKLKRNVGGYMKEMVREVPVKWVNLQESLQRIGETKLCITFEEVSRIGTECEISKEGLATAIEYMNDIGIILHSSTNKKLKNTVITDLKMMIQMVTKVITVVKPSIKVKQMRVLWKRLDEEGMLEERLLRYLWEQELEEDPHRFEVFTEVMKTFGLLFEKLKIGCHLN